MSDERRYRVIDAMKRRESPENPVGQFGGARTQVFVKVLGDLHVLVLMNVSRKRLCWRGEA
jgi:hypothetical protein